jgi:hypothetical protein
MDFLNDTIRFQNQQSAVAWQLHQRAIITRRSDHPLSNRQRREQLLEQPIFAHLAQFHR